MGLRSPSPTGCSYGAEPPRRSPLTVTSKSTALPTWLSRRTALSPRTVPPKKSRGGTATLRGQQGQCSPGRGGIAAPHPISTHPVTERGSSMTTRARATTGSRVGCSLILGTTKELGWGASQSLSIPSFPPPPVRLTWTGPAPLPGRWSAG